MNKISGCSELLNNPQALENAVIQSLLPDIDADGVDIIQIVEGPDGGSIVILAVATHPDDVEDATAAIQEITTYTLRHKSK